MEKSSFFNSTDGDRKYDATYWAEYFSSFIENGVFLTTGADLSLNISPYGDRAVLLRPGKAFVNGYFYHNDDDLSIDIPAGDPTRKRIDSVIIQWNLSERQIKAVLRSSTPAENPTPVTPTRTAEVWELVVAEIFVGKGDAQVTITNIKDKRYDPTVCGIVTSVGQPIDTTKLNELIDNLFTRYDELVEKIEGAGITTYTAVDTSNNIKVTANGVTPKVGDIIAVRMTNPGNDSGVLPGATLTFNSKTNPIKCMDGAWTSKPIAKYAGAMLMYGSGYWTLLTFDGGITNKTIFFPSGGAVTPENGVSLDIGTATSDVTINRASGSATKITAFVTFKKGTATKITFAPDYNFKNNVFDLSDIDTNAFVVVNIVNGTVSVGKSI